MKQPIDDKKMRCYLSAFADGELDVDKSVQVLERIAMDPAMSKRVAHQQQLRKCCCQTMSEPSQCPDVVKQQLQAMATDLPMEQPPHRRPTILARIGRWIPAAMAAMFLLAALAVIDVTGPGAGINPAITHVMDNSIVDRFARRHVTCSAGIAQLENASRFPTNISELPGALSDYFGKQFQLPTLDLSVLGYTYQKTGECHVPGTGSVHVLYRAAQGTGHNDTLSLWMRPYDASLNLQEGKLYTAAGGEKAHPLLMWRSKGMTYYLAGDSMDTTQQAANVLRVSG